MTADGAGNILTISGTSHFFKGNLLHFSTSQQSRQPLLGLTTLYICISLYIFCISGCIRTKKIIITRHYKKHTYIPRRHSRISQYLFAYIGKKPDHTRGEQETENSSSSLDALLTTYLQHSWSWPDHPSLSVPSGSCRGLSSSHGLVLQSHRFMSFSKPRCAMFHLVFIAVLPQV